MRRVLAGLLCLLLLLGGCARDNAPAPLVLDVETAPRTLDPQRASDDTALLILYNVFEGLTRDGAMNEVIVESFSQPSPTVWRFVLRADAQWSDGAALTADDFVCAFERLSGLHAHSPYPALFNSIEGFDGRGTFGVRAVNERTVEFRLWDDDPLFLDKLSLSAAFPCRRDFFASTRGRYGQDHATLVGNGAFVVTRVRDDSVTITPNERWNRTDAQRAPGVRFVVTPDEQTRADRFAAGDTDLAPLNATQLPPGAVTLHEEGTILWTMLCRVRDDSPLSDPLLREALLGALDAQALSAALPDSWHGLLEPYRSGMAGLRLTLTADRDAAQRAARAYYAQAGVGTLPQLHCIVRDDAFFPAVAADIQRLWLELALPVNIRPLPADEFDAALRSGDFDLAIAPIAVADGQPRDVLASLTGSGTIADLGVRDEDLAALIVQTYTTDVSAQRTAVNDAAQLLLDRHLMRPLWGERRVLAARGAVAITVGGGAVLSERITAPRQLLFYAPGL